MLDILLASTSPEQSDVVLEKLDSDIAAGDSIAASAKDLLHLWADKKATGVTASHGDQVEEADATRTVQAYRALTLLYVGASDADRIQILDAVLATKVEYNDLLAITLSAMLTTALKDLQGLAHTAVRRETASEPDASARLDENEAGGYTFSAQDTRDFVPDHAWDEISDLVRGLIHDSDDVTGSKLMRRSADRYPPAWDDRVSEAVDLKRRGRFLESAKIYEKLSRESGMLYTGIIASLYKTTAASGALLSANFLLMNGINTFHRDPKAVANAAGRPSSFEDHHKRLMAAVTSPTELESYLRDLSGNVNYRLPRSYADSAGELMNHLMEVRDRFAQVNKQRKGGCYIATAVYGSYEAPAVMTLRRFRDATLQASGAGRAFVRFYYAISPPLADWLSAAPRANAIVRRVLDRVVVGLDRRHASMES